MNFALNAILKKIKIKLSVVGLIGSYRFQKWYCSIIVNVCLSFFCVIDYDYRPLAAAPLASRGFLFIKTGKIDENHPTT